MKGGQSMPYLRGRAVASRIRHTEKKYFLSSGANGTKERKKERQTDRKEKKRTY